MKKIYLQEKYISWLEYLIVIGLSIIPLFVSLPYRVNIFLSWEGAYRLYLGEIPYRDFGLPMGIGFWVVPAIFFKIFGPYLITLVKAQVFINIISGLAFRSIIKSLSVNPPIRLLSVLVYCISFSLFNFWPWYDQSVIVFEIVGISFLLRYVFSKKNKWLYMLLACFFLFYSFFTKQDGGGMAFLLAGAITLYYSITEKKFTPILLYTGCYALIGAIVIIPLLKYNFNYWFNYGQAGHNTRLSAFDMIDMFLGQSDWLKFYLFLTILLIIFQLKNTRSFFRDKKQFIFALLTLGILGEAAIFQVTSYTPPDNNIFFQGFAFAFIFANLEFIKKIELTRPRFLFIAILLTLLWWSGSYWKYIDRIVQRAFPSSEKLDYNVVNMHTYMLPQKQDTTDFNGEMTNWVYCHQPAFKKIYMPQSTADGIDRLMNNPLIKNHPQNLKVLNMSELTPLDYAIGYKLETGPYIPLWYHKNVAMYEKEIKTYEKKISAHYYNLVLFEYVPRLNNFYPFEIRDSLKVHYKKIDSFSGPRRAMYSVIEVYVPSDSIGKINKILSAK